MIETFSVTFITVMSKLTQNKVKYLRCGIINISRRRVIILKIGKSMLKYSYTVITMNLNDSSLEMSHTYRMIRILYLQGKNPISIQSQHQFYSNFFETKNNYSKNLERNLYSLKCMLLHISAPMLHKQKSQISYIELLLFIGFKVQGEMKCWSNYNTVKI